MVHAAGRRQRRLDAAVAQMLEDVRQALLTVAGGDLQERDGPLEDEGKTDDRSQKNRDHDRSALDDHRPNHVGGILLEWGGRRKPRQAKSIERARGRGSPPKRATSPSRSL